MNNFVVMVFLDNWDATEKAIYSVLDQTIPVRLLLIDNGSEWENRDKALDLVTKINGNTNPAKVLFWSHNPPLRSLSATWNHALDFIWSLGESRALVVNNDILVRDDTYDLLLEVGDHPHYEEFPLFVSAVGRREDTWENDRTRPIDPDNLVKLPTGGPDFSCFMITKLCHEQFKFDENITPCYTEDVDYHRRIMIAGLGKLIFSVPIPYLHYASGTLKAMDPKRREQVERAIENGARTYYKQKWGGSVNEETTLVPFNHVKGDHITTSEMFNCGCNGYHHGEDSFLDDPDGLAKLDGTYIKVGEEGEISSRKV